MLLSANPDDTNLVNAGYANVGTATFNSAGDDWQSLASSVPPEARYDHTAIWTGKEMIVWGGRNETRPVGPFNNGARYDPVANRWTGMSAPNPCSGCFVSSAVWTGYEMIIPSRPSGCGWGSCYNPVANGWTDLAQYSGCNGGPAVWTGQEMIGWDGSNGARYNPASNSWTALPLTGAPSSRSGHTAVWTGRELIVWGGSYLSDGARYDPAANTWTAMTQRGAPSPRQQHTAVWTGREMIVWGGYSLNDGGRYNPVLNSWKALSTNGAPSVRGDHSAVWTGREMLIWGGMFSGGNPLLFFGDTFSYNPTPNLYHYRKQ
jgi:N-acetylneuraminic acid mutarotase